jgi:hypothetical protein
MTETETFRLLAWTWDVSAAKRYAANRAPNGQLLPRNWTALLALIMIDVEHAQTVNLAEPLIAVPASPCGEPLVIDGWHRIYQALVTEVEPLPMITLSAEEEYACRICGGEKGYR